MRQFFSRPHPWIMQAVGGLIAAIVFVPVAVVVWINVLNSPNQKALPTPLAPPVAVAAASPTVAVTNGSGRTYTVKMEPGPGVSGYVFSPAKLTIHVGDTIHWVDVNAVPHNIVGSDSAARKLINKTAIDTKGYIVTFTTAGTFHYVCQVHLPSMIGTITVVASPSSGTPAGSGAQSSGSGTSTTSYTVKMQPGPGASGYVFSPAKLSIHVGDTVHWVDVDAVPHNIVGTGSAASVINRAAINTASYTLTFSKAGVYHYECQVHLPSMIGTITVT